MDNYRILLVDDEKTIIAMQTKRLERLGYQVIAQNSSREALDVFRMHPDNYDIVISDMNMPHMTGDILTRKMLEIRPDIPIILCTGFSERMNEEDALSIGARAMMIKPVLFNELSDTIRKVLEVTN